MVDFILPQPRQPRELVCRVHANGVKVVGDGTALEVLGRRHAMRGAVEAGQESADGIQGRASAHGRGRSGRHRRDGEHRGLELDGSDVERLLLPLGKLLSPPTVPGSTAPLTLVNASFSYDTLAMGCQSYTAELPMELPWPWLDLSARDLLLVRGGVPSRAAAFCRCSPSLRVAWWLRSRWLRSR